MPEGHSLKRKHGRGRKEAGEVAGYLKMNFDRDCDIKESQKIKEHQRHTDTHTNRR